jgi:hypothetical protein
LGRKIEDSVVVAVDDEIFQDAYRCAAAAGERERVDPTDQGTVRWLLGD